MWFATYLMIVFPMLISLHSMARENHDVLAGKVDARFVATNLAVFAQHPILQQQSIDLNITKISFKLACTELIGHSIQHSANI